MAEPILRQANGRRISWRNGTTEPFMVEATVMRLRPAEGRQPGKRKDDSSNLPEKATLRAADGCHRWITKQVHQQMKEEPGQGHVK